MITVLGILIVIGIASAIPIAIGKKLSIKLNAKQKKWWLILHILFVILYFSGILGSLLLALFTRWKTDHAVIHSAHLFIEYFDWFLIIPGMMGSLMTGFWLAVGAWGITRHYWVIVKWVGTITAILFGSTIMDTWIHESFTAISANSIQPVHNPDSHHNQKMIIGFLLVLTNAIFLTVISYVKPWGKRKKWKIDASKG
ncbi:hypothetical protein [Lihuaxuella thermophila]|uniref:DUF2269 domain-containing protein n=1 Tax=Lihuaxuella thermophila TaxID=1173111 RepID=A0A1H8ITI0_9BACL|nr:hypothetical protein [Lihuaxuella thermophila]SEN71465.1 hypothetical protein SAMN05444955_11933 [Lihuaxuella thermophila]